MNKLDDKMTEKTFKMSCKQERIELKIYVHCFIIGWYSNSLHNNVNIYLNKNFQLRGNFKGFK